MNDSQIVTCIFRSKKSGLKFSMYINMLRTLAYSIKKNTNTKLTVYENGLNEDIKQSIHANFVTIASVSTSNIIESAPEKTQLWLQVIKESKRNTILLDVDMLVLKDPRDIFQNDFDIACTPGRGGAVNIGFLAFRPSTEVNLFAEEWNRKTNILLTDPNKHRQVMVTHGSGDQYTFCDTKESSKLKIIEVPWKEYNLHDLWENPRDSKVVHFKNKWVEVVNRPVYIPGYSNWPTSWKCMFDLWKEYNKEQRQTV